MKNDIDPIQNQAKPQTNIPRLIWIKRHNNERKCQQLTYLLLILDGSFKLNHKPHKEPPEFISSFSFHLPHSNFEKQINWYATHTAFTQAAESEWIIQHQSINYAKDALHIYRVFVGYTSKTLKFPFKFKFPFRKDKCRSKDYRYVPLESAGLLAKMNFRI
jgi:hypothetical protein